MRNVTMKNFLGTLLLLTGCGQAGQPDETPAQPAASAQVTPGTPAAGWVEDEDLSAPAATPAADSLPHWFVQLGMEPTSRGGDAAALKEERAAFWDAVRVAKLDVEPRYNFTRLWNGLSVSASARTAQDLEEMPHVQAVYPVVLVYQHAETPGPLPSDPDLFSALGMTGADVAQNTLGLTGAGVKVGIIDTGIDINHPDLGGTPAGCFGPGCRVAFGYDLVGDAYDATTNGTVSPDPIPDDCGGHGSHVAGIVGANGAVKGVAPGVTFGAYRVFGCSGTTNSDVMVKAMELADRDGMRVVNMSIGSAYEWPDYPSAAAANQLVANGVVVVASIGNNGAATGLGPWFAAGAPGVAARVLGVASVDNAKLAQKAFAVSPDDTLVGFNPASGAPAAPLSGSFPLARTGTVTTTNDGCTALPAGSLTGMVVLVRRGTCPFFIKATNMQGAGAAAVVLYNNAAGELSPTVAGTPAITIPVVAITQANGALINARMDAGAVTLRWTTSVAQTANPTAGQASTFSSWGPTPELGFKPDLAAPGGSIYSTYPLELGGYASLSGTSMASPHVAGSVALLLQARPSVTPDQVKLLVSNTAVPVGWTGDASGVLRDAVQRQGAGLIRVDQAVLQQVTVEPAALPLGESTVGAVTRRLLLTNTGATDLTFDLSHTAAVSTTGSHWTPTYTASGLASLSFDAPSVTVPAGATATVNVSITEDAVLAAGSFYGGYVVLTPQGGGAVLRVPYSGYKGDYQVLPVLTPTANNYPWLTRLVGNVQTKQASEATYTLQGGDFPYVTVHLDRDARRVVLEVFAATDGKPAGTAIDWTGVAQNTTATATFAWKWNGRTLQGKRWVDVPDGRYLLKLSVLKPLGNEGNAADWETWTSPVVALAR